MNVPKYPGQSFRLSRICIQLICIVLATHVSVVALAGEVAMSIDKQPFGKMPDGTDVDMFIIKNGRGLEATVLTLGATLHTVSFPDRHGKTAILTRHEDTVTARIKDMWATGAVVGRFANRIAGASFSIGSDEYKLEANAGKHQIHGGSKGGYQRLVWKAEPIRSTKNIGVKMELISPDGQGGFPGTAKVSVAYTLNSRNELTIDYSATTDQTTHINLTNHAYWNLGGVDKGDVKLHVLQVLASQYLLVDADLIPTGEIADVKGTPLDFNAPRPIGSHLDPLPNKKYYDQCFVLAKPATGSPATLIAKVIDPGSGRMMDVLTTQPGLQLFTGHPQGFCLETQHYPDSPHHPNFPSTLLSPGETFHEQTIHRFSVQP